MHNGAGPEVAVQPIEGLGVVHFPSTADSGSSGSLVKDYLWGTELYPRLGDWDLKRFVNCRFWSFFLVLLLVRSVQRG